jgi:hypothetical protein
MMGTDLQVRRTLDMTRAPTEQWNEEMMKLVASQVLKRASTKGEQLYCLAVADALGLNPFIDEIYFLPTKSKDGSGPGLKPYIGRNGLVKKATDRGAYFEADTVHENDKFRMARKRDGTVEVSHSYGAADRGEILGAYAFLHFRNGDRPAFFYAKLDEYLPTFDAEWKMAASPWGNQRSAMIEKCAMIGAGRKRLDLGNVLMDGELPIYEQQQAAGPDTATVVEAEVEPFGFDGLPERLRVAVARVEELSPGSWPPAKCEMVFTGMSDAELDAIAVVIEGEADLLAERAVVDAPGRSEEQAGDASSEEPASAEGLTEAEVVEEVLPPVESVERAAMLRARLRDLEDRMNEPELLEHESVELDHEYSVVEAQLHALEDPGQGSLI